MKIFAISDLHLSFQTDKPMTDEVGHMLGASLARTKPMDLFGDHWANYEQRIMEDWNAKVSVDDVGIIAGDISWAMKMEDTKADFDFISKLNGTKIIIRGNHDYWWKSISKIRETLPQGIVALQNDSVKIGDVVFAGTRGWRVPERFGRGTKQDAEDKKIFDREVIRFELALKDAVNRRQTADGRQQGPDSARHCEGTEAIPSLTAEPQGSAKQVLIAILHYPPFNSTRDDSPFTALCEKYGVSACVYGHLHGKNCRAELFTQKNGVKYYLTSCDLLQHKVIEIT